MTAHSHETSHWAHNVVATLIQVNDVNSTSQQRRVPSGVCAAIYVLSNINFFHRFLQIHIINDLPFTDLYVLIYEKHTSPSLCLIVCLLRSVGHNHVLQPLFVLFMGIEGCEVGR